MTSDVDWDPTRYDNVNPDIHIFYDAEADTIHHSTFDDCGNYRHRTVATHNTHPEPEYFDVHESPAYSDMIDDLLDAHHPALLENIYQVHAVEASPTPRDYELLKSYLFRHLLILSSARLLLLHSTHEGGFLTLFVNIGSPVSLHAM
jgi:hypothetical protein